MRGGPGAILRTLYQCLDVIEVRCAPLAGGLTSGMGIIVISLWFWREAARVADGAGAAYPNLAIDSIRLAAVAGICGAQVILLTSVVGRIHRPTVFDELFKRVAVLVAVIALAAAVAFALLAQ